MPEDKKFLVGITPDWEHFTERMLGQGLREVLDPLPGLKYEMMPDTNWTATAESVRRYDAIIHFGYYLPRECLEGVERLVCISRYGVGFDRIDVEACTEADVLVALAPKGSQRPVAEGAIALMFAVAKNLRIYDQWVRDGTWQDKLDERGICFLGRTLGSVGLGNIASETCRIGRGIGFGRILAYDPYVSKERAAEIGVELVDLATVMRESDFITVHTPLNPETKGLIGAEEIGLMKPTAFLINTARGPVVDEAALVDALKHRRIAGAGLDVLEQEPPPKDHPLFALDNVALAPHCLAMTVEHQRDIGLEACENVRLAYEGKVPPHLANPEVVERPGMQEKLAARKKG